MKRKQIKVAAVQPQAYWGEEEWKNAARALEYVDEAVKTGAELICFPEGYPGPAHGPLDSGGHLSFRPIDALCEKAKEHGVYICASNLEENAEIEDTYYLTLKLISPDGEILANYKRVQPDDPYLNEYLHGGRMHVLPGDEIMVVDTELGKIGLQICSELFVPEIARVQMLMGAEIIISPVNGQHSRTRPRLTETWNRLRIGGDSSQLKDVYRAATLDMERLAWFRTRYYLPEFFREPDEEYPVTKCRPGQIHQRRPELYQLLVAPQEDAFDYFYYKRGLDAWKEEYERVKGAYYPRVRAAEPIKAQ